MNRITEIQGGIPAAESRKPEQPKNDLFQQDLEAARAKQQPGTSSINAKPLGEVSPTFIPPVSTPSKEVAGSAERLLDMLETYSKEMANPVNTLKDLEPLIRSIQEKASGLMAVADKMPADPELKKIVYECAVTANTAYIKYYRGDYI